MKLSDYLQTLTFDIPFNLEHLVISDASFPLKVGHHTFPVPLSPWDMIKEETGVRQMCVPPHQGMAPPIMSMLCPTENSGDRHWMNVALSTVAKNNN